MWIDKQFSHVYTYDILDFRSKRNDLHKTIILEQNPSEEGLNDTW